MTHNENTSGALGALPAETGQVVQHLSGTISLYMLEQPLGAMLESPDVTADGDPDQRRFHHCSLATVRERTAVEPGVHTEILQHPRRRPYRPGPPSSPQLSANRIESAGLTLGWRDVHTHWERDRDHYSRWSEPTFGPANRSSKR